MALSPPQVLTYCYPTTAAATLSTFACHTIDQTDGSVPGEAVAATEMRWAEVGSRALAKQGIQDRVGEGGGAQERQRVALAQQ